MVDVIHQSRVPQYGFLQYGLRPFGLMLAMSVVWIFQAFCVESVFAESAYSESPISKLDAAQNSGNSLGLVQKTDLLAKLLVLERFGVDIPTSLVAAINRFEDFEGKEQVTGRHLDRWASLLLENPGKLGEISYVNEPLIAGKIVNIQQSIKIGSHISPGGGILIAKHWLHPIHFQFEDENAPNFLQVSLNTTGARTVETALDIRLEAVAGIHGGLDSKIDLPFIYLKAGSLEVGDELVIEHKNLVLPEKANNSFSLPVYFREIEGGLLTEFKNERLTVYGGVVAEAEVIVPTYVRPGISFSAKIFLKDEYGNLAEGRMPSFDLTVDGEFFQRMPAGTQNTHLVEGIQLEYGKTHHIDVRSSGGGIRGGSNPFRLINTRKKILWGDPSVQVSLGEGIDSPDNTLLDYSIVAIHDEYLTKSRWQSIQGRKSWVWGKGLRSGGYHQLITAWHQKGIHTQTELVTKMLGENVLNIATLANPIDDRFVNNKQTRLVELVANKSHFETQANTLLKKGYRLGFTGSNHSHLIPLGTRVNAALTAVVVEDGEDWFTALKRGSTYVTTGHRLLLEFSVNNAQAGERARSSETRILKGRVQGTFGLHKIEIFKNGEVIHTKFVSRPALEEEKLLKVTFQSESAPYQSQRDLPRNGREWIGYFSSDATMVNVEAPGFVDPSRQGIVQSQNNRVDFITWTRGSASSFMLGFEALSEDAVFELNMREAHEDIDVKPLRRLSSAIPAARQLVSLFDLSEGPVRRLIKVNGYSDQVTFEFVKAESETDASFNYIDDSEPKDGDYYYVRVQQLDDQMAWSSPIFVGGYDQP